MKDIVKSQIRTVILLSGQQFKMQQLRALLAILFIISHSAYAEDPQTSFLDDLPTITVEVKASKEERKNPVSAFDAPVSELQVDPLVDLQSRGFPEAQSDITIRGGTFENSGIRLGAAGIFDPQTGHYLSEIPLSTEMLEAPARLSGLNNAFSAFNANAGSLTWALRPIHERHRIVSAGAGDFKTNTQHAYFAETELINSAIGSLGADASFSRFESSGTRPDADSRYGRGALRLQQRSESSQTDLLGAYQEKFFAWPDLYAPHVLHELARSSDMESEDLSTALFLLNHKSKYGNGSFVEASAYHRRNHDDYEFDRYQKGLFNAYLHTTRVSSVSADGKHVLENRFIRYSGSLIVDEIDSSSLVFGPFSSRSWYNASLMPGYVIPVDDMRTLTFQVGASVNDTNRDHARVSPFGGIELANERQLGIRDVVYIDISQNSQLPNYTALGSNPDSGLFRGNPDLGRTISTNYESGIRIEREKTFVSTAVFYRYDKDLIDWTYDSNVPFAARSANNMDTGTFGAESVLWHNFGLFEVRGGYTFLNKASHYAQTGVDASFYALNFPNHRIVLSLMTSPFEEVSIRLDNEWRQQEANVLRDSGNRDSFISSISCVLGIPEMKGAEILVSVYNIGRENFQSIPGVPSEGRLALGELRWSW